MKGNNTGTGRFISLILRHKPEVIGITLDEHGWANVEELIAGVNQTRPLDTAGPESIRCIPAGWRRRAIPSTVPSTTFG